MPSPKTCSRCGAPLGADVPGGICLLGLGLQRAAPAEMEEEFRAITPEDDFPGYQIIGQIGEGGCGVVYRALQTTPVLREVALKVTRLHPWLEHPDPSLPRRGLGSGRPSLPQTLFTQDAA